MYDQIMSLNAEPLEEAVQTAVRVSNHAEEARFRSLLEDYLNAQKNELDSKVRGYHTNVPFYDEAWSQWSHQRQVDQIKAASALYAIQYKLSDPVLSELAAEQLTNADLRAYLSDGEFGAYGVEQDFRLHKVDEAGFGGSARTLVTETLLWTWR